MFCGGHNKNECCGEIIRIGIISATLFGRVPGGANLQEIMKILRVGMVSWLCMAAQTSMLAAPVNGWLGWRGPQQSGVSLEKGLPDKIDGRQALWTADYPGQST